MNQTSPGHAVPVCVPLKRGVLRWGEDRYPLKRLGQCPLGLQPSADFLIRGPHLGWWSSVGENGGWESVLQPAGQL